MAVSASNRVQANDSGGPVTGTGFTATLPNPTMDGSTLFLFACTGGTGNLPISSQTFDPPFFQETNINTGPIVWRRDAQPAGETSWAITGSSGTYLWRIEEWAGLSGAGNPDANASVKTNATSPATTNTVTPDVSDFAALAAFRGGPTGSLAWAARVYPSGWAEVDYLANGDGTGANDFNLAVIESYPGASGAMSTQITWDTSGGGAVPASTNAWVACYQPDAPPPAVVAMSVAAP